MNGAIIPHTPIAVDIWSRFSVTNCRLFFLSHAHSDHTVGLTSSWKNHKIYCSEITKNIVVHKLGVRSDLLVGLPVDIPITISMDEYGQEKLTVTLIDANHCPGAVMFLFEGYFGTVLYTGDFRFHKSMLEHHTLKDKTIDKLYLDNTYCDPQCSFPTRSKASYKVLEIVQKHLKRNFKIVIGVKSLGKEDLLVNVAVSSECWIGVDPQRLNLLKVLNVPDVFTSDLESTRIRVVMQREVTKQNLEDWNSIHPTIAILPTSLFQGDINPYQYMSNVFVVPFSDHSSYEELVSFVSAIRPKEITPIVLKHKSTNMGPNNFRTNMSVFSSCLDNDPLCPIVIPDTVLKYMSNGTGKKRAKPRSTYNYHAYKRRKCSGVVFPDEIPNRENSMEDLPVEKKENKTSESNTSLQGLTQSHCSNEPNTELSASKETFIMHDYTERKVFEKCGSQNFAESNTTPQEEHKQHSKISPLNDIDSDLYKISDEERCSESKPVSSSKKKLSSLDLITRHKNSKRESKHCEESPQSSLTSKPKTNGIHSTMKKTLRNETTRRQSVSSKRNKCIPDFYRLPVTSKTADDSSSGSEHLASIQDVQLNVTNTDSSKDSTSKTDISPKPGSCCACRHMCKSTPCNVKHRKSIVDYWSNQKVVKSMDDYYGSETVTNLKVKKCDDRNTNESPSTKPESLKHGIVSAQCENSHRDTETRKNPSSSKDTGLSHKSSCTSTITNTGDSNSDPKTPAKLQLSESCPRNTEKNQKWKKTKACISGMKYQKHISRTNMSYNSTATNKKHASRKSGTIASQLQSDNCQRDTAKGKNTSSCRSEDSINTATKEPHSNTTTINRKKLSSCKTNTTSQPTAQSTPCKSNLPSRTTKILTTADDFYHPAEPSTSGLSEVNSPSKYHKSKVLRRSDLIDQSKFNDNELNQETVLYEDTDDGFCWFTTHTWNNRN